MRGLLSKILLSLVISVVIALLVVVVITRISLHRGMVHYIEQQEAGQLEKLAPEQLAKLTTNSTRNSEAFNLFLKGKYIHRNRYYGNMKEED